MRKVIVVCAILLMLDQLGMADAIYLKDGQVFRGGIVSQNDQSVVIEVYGGNKETIYKQYIDRIIMGDENSDQNWRPRRRWYTGRERDGSDELIFKIGFDFNGKQTTSNNKLFIDGTGNPLASGNQDVDPGTSFTGEYVSYVSKNIGLGGGLTLQSPRGLSNMPGTFSFAPLYALVKVRTTPGKRNFYEYLTGQVGYNFFGGDTSYLGRNSTFDGGLYCGVGAGVVINRIQLELLYTQTQGRANDWGYLYNSGSQTYAYFNESGDITYSKLGLNIGFIF
jgi:hypothetical protein